MKAPHYDDLRLIAHGLRFYGKASSAELINRLIGSLSRKESWEVIAEAERIGMIEPAGPFVENMPPEVKMWRLVEGYDLGWLDMRPQTHFVASPAGRQGSA